MPLCGGMFGLVLLLLPVRSISTLETTTDSETAALAVDEQCGESEEACALSALQLHSQKVAGETLADRSDGSCNDYGCAGYNPSQSCQCNAKCAEHGNCCSDFTATCNAPAAGQPAAGGSSCHAFGCGKYVPSQKCQCNSKCAEHGNCCDDYSATCTAPAAGQPAAGGSSCHAFGCGKYVKSAPCQCNEGCQKHHNCCSDYQPVCTARPEHIYGHPSASKSYPAYPGFTLTLVEEFDAPLDLNSDPIWTWSDGGLIEGQIRYVKENIKFGNGMMKIQVNDKPTNNIEECSHAESAKIPKKKLTGGEVRTKQNMFRYGRYEAAIKAPSPNKGNTKVNGNYIATMFVFRDGKYKHWREIDVEITGDKVDSVHTNVLSADDTPNWNADMGEEGDDHVFTNLREGFHSYAIEWLPNSITWFFDGRVIRHKTGGKIPIPSMSTKIMMSTWVFDDRALFGGKHIENDQWPLETEYDWIRFYKWDGDHQYPCSGLGTQCLTSDDKYLSGNNPCDGVKQEGTVNGTASCIGHCRF